MTGYQIAKYIILFEFMVIALIVAATFVLKIGSIFLKNRREKLTTEIKHHLTHLVARDLHLDLKNFPWRWRKLTLLLPIFQEYDSVLHGKRWNRLKQELVHSIFLPRARQRMKSPRWVTRFYAAKAFSYSAESIDEPLMIKLVNDPVPLVFFTAIQAAVNHRSEKALNAVIDRLAKGDWSNESLFLQAFENASSITCYFIKRRLINETNNNIRATCYNILLKYSRVHITWDVTNDVNSTDMNLKIAAIKLVTHSNKTLALPILIQSLKDDHWEVRTVALRSLSHIRAVQAISSIAVCLRDTDWWVKLAAAQTLKRLGKEGIAVLKSQDIELNPGAYRVAQHVLGAF